jgi:hypothetical protein
MAEERSAIMIKFLFGVVVCASVWATGARGQDGLSVADEAEAGKPNVIEVLESVTNAPCMDVVSDKPYGFPLTVECPFSVSKDLLDQAVEMARAASDADIKTARAGHLTHPMWSPGVYFRYDSYRTNQQSIVPSLRIWFHDAKETREKGKAGCGRDLISISAATLSASFREQTNEVFVIDDTDVVLNVRCEKTERDGNQIFTSDVPLDEKARAKIQGFLLDLNDGKYIYPAQPEELKSIAGKVYPGDEEKKIIPEALSATAFAKVDADDEPFEMNGNWDDYELVMHDALHRGHAMEASELARCYLEYDVGTGCIDLRWSSGKYSARGASYGKVDGIWIKSAIYSIRY